MSIVRTGGGSEKVTIDGEKVREKLNLYSINNSYKTNEFPLQFIGSRSLTEISRVVNFKDKILVSATGDYNGYYIPHMIIYFDGTEWVEVGKADSVGEPVVITTPTKVWKINLGRITNTQSRIVYERMLDDGSGWQIIYSSTVNIGEPVHIRAFSINEDIYVLAYSNVYGGREIQKNGKSIGRAWSYPNDFDESLHSVIVTFENKAYIKFKENVIDVYVCDGETMQKFTDPSSEISEAFKSGTLGIDGDKLYLYASPTTGTLERIELKTDTLSFGEREKFADNFKFNYTSVVNYNNEYYIFSGDDPFGVYEIEKIYKKVSETNA